MTQADYMNQNPGSDVSEHRAAVKQAIIDGMPVTADVLADYPEFKKARKQKIPAAIPMEPVAETAPVEETVPTPPPPPKMTFEERQTAELKRIQDRQNEEVRKYNEQQDEEIRKMSARTDQELGINNDEAASYGRKQDEEIQKMQARWDTEVGKVGSEADDYNAKQDAEIEKMKRRWDTEIGRSAFGNGISSSAPVEQTEENILSQVEPADIIEENNPDVVQEENNPDYEFTPSELLKLHLSRSRQARVIDERYRANDTVSPNDQAGVRRWVKNPAKTDIEGIDTPQSMEPFSPPG